jgi:ArsR family transcriptional regulator, arsenate/arsenite/antimonite-responsive transcriptional repressor
MENLKELETLGKMLGEKIRLKILLLLSNQEINSSRIHKLLRLPQNLTSHHLQTLLKHNFVKARRDGRFAYYSVNKAVIKNLAGKLKILF